ncbi:hypothetical protein ACFOKF_16870 [Sphingobium rhizovicinum]|uniref:Uncharacterized protein n=1 Tax=Sphingobium rhizovicinum TaxID=432308 RepID=A0ABV7NHA2_9SPHN
MPQAQMEQIFFAVATLPLPAYSAGSAHRGAIMADWKGRRADWVANRAEWRGIARHG